MLVPGRRWGRKSSLGSPTPLPLSPAHPSIFFSNCLASYPEALSPGRRRWEDLVRETEAVYWGGAGCCPFMGAGRQGSRLLIHLLSVSHGGAVMLGGKVGGGRFSWSPRACDTAHCRPPSTRSRSSVAVCFCSQLSQVVPSVWPVVSWSVFLSVCLSVCLMSASQLLWEEPPGCLQTSSSLRVSQSVCSWLPGGIPPPDTFSPIRLPTSLFPALSVTFPAPPFPLTRHPRRQRAYPIPPPPCPRVTLRRCPGQRPCVL